MPLAAEGPHFYASDGRLAGNFLLRLVLDLLRHLPDKLLKDLLRVLRKLVRIHIGRKSELQVDIDLRIGRNLPNAPE